MHIVNCPYCGSSDTVAYHSVRLPLFSWPLPAEQSADNPIVETEVRMCRGCLFGFNSKPLSPELEERMYRDYVYIKPTMGFGSSVHERFIEFIGRRVSKIANILEIGSSDGYLLSRLKMDGYRMLTAMDPNPRFPESFDVPLRKEFFSEKTVFDEPVDVYLMQNVFQYFAKPWEILGAISPKLPADGAVMIESPLYTIGIHHQHRSFMTIPFLQKIAAESGFAISEINYSGDSYRAALSKAGSSERYFSGAGLEAEVRNVLDTIATFESEERELRDRLNAFVEGAGKPPVYWYGTGIAAHLLSGYLSSAASAREFTVVDGDRDRKGLIYTPTGTEVQFAGDCLAGKNIESIVLATSLYSEVRRYLESIGCRAERMFLM